MHLRCIVFCRFKEALQTNLTSGCWYCDEFCQHKTKAINQTVFKNSPLKTENMLVWHKWNSTVSYSMENQLAGSTYLKSSSFWLFVQFFFWMNEFMQHFTFMLWIFPKSVALKIQRAGSQCCIFLISFVFSLFLSSHNFISTGDIHI